MRSGPPAGEIVRFAKDHDIDLIVMGTHGRGVVGHIVLGSVAEKVVRTGGFLTEGAPAMVAADQKL